MKALLSTTLIPSNIVNAAENCVLKSLDIGKRALNIEIPFEGVQFFHKSSTAGYVIPARSNIVYLNYDFLKNNLGYFLQQTIPHEVAHLFARAIQAKKRQMEGPHGKTWKWIMRHVYGLDPMRTHDLDLTQSPSSRKKVKYICNCKKHLLTEACHKKVQKGIKNYRCVECKSSLTFLSKID